jgi:hypothetical protein
METISENWLYFNNKSNTHRYILGEKGEKMLACIGVNPSTAKPNELDNTLKSVKRIAESNGYEGWIMYNLYPQIATNPIDLDNEIDCDENLTNMVSIQKSLENFKIDNIWLAWGDLIDTREYLKFCLYKLNWYLSNSKRDFNFKIVDIPTIAGNPKHPLYKNSNSKLYNFDLQKYITEKVSKKIIEKYDGITLNGLQFK